MNSLEGYSTSTNSREFTIGQIKDIIFKARILSSDLLDEFYSLDEEAAEQGYKPYFKYDDNEILESYFLNTKQ